MCFAKPICYKNSQAVEITKRFSPYLEAHGATEQPNKLSDFECIILLALLQKTLK